MRTTAVSLRTILLLGSAALLVGCYPRNAPLEPQLSYTPAERDIEELPAPFKPLTTDQRQEDWGKEYQIGVRFARELDLYRAITSFKRALALLPPQEILREQEIQYSIALSYYLGTRYQEVIRTVERSSLNRTTPAFPAYRELLILLYESYRAVNRPRAATVVLERLNRDDTEAACSVALSAALTCGNLTRLQQLACSHPTPELTRLITGYQQRRKSVGHAQLASAILPGAGYWYVGQRQSAITAFLLNALFITASAQLFAHGHWALGVFTTSLELGWYFGGIHGAGEAAHLYNRRLYERLARPVLDSNRLHPLFMLR